MFAYPSKADLISKKALPDFVDLLDDLVGTGKY
jgi:hypothetical protein